VQSKMWPNKITLPTHSQRADGECICKLKRRNTWVNIVQTTSNAWHQFIDRSRLLNQYLSYHQNLRNTWVKIFQTTSNAWHHFPDRSRLLNQCLSYHQTSLLFKELFMLGKFRYCFFMKGLVKEKDVFCWWEMTTISVCLSLPAWCNFIELIFKVKLLRFYQVKALLAETNQIRSVVLPIPIFMNKNSIFQFLPAKSRLCSIVNESLSKKS